MSAVRPRKPRTFIVLALLSTFLGFALLPAGFATDVGVNMFGPKQYLRTKNSVDVYTDTFRGVPGQGTLVIQNGDGKGHNLVEDLLITINGVALPDWSDLLQPGYKLDAPIAMDDNNSILVIILGKPGSYLTIQAQAEITPDATTTQVIGIAGGTASVENHLGDTFTLQVPPLALAQDTTISMSALPNALPSPIAQNLSPGVVFGPSGTEFSLPATVAVSLHQPLTNPGALLFSFEDSNYVLPTANQTAVAAQNSILGEILHFSPPTSVGLPTESELEGMTYYIFGQPFTTPEDLVDRVNSLVTITKDWDILGYDVKDFDPSYYAVTLLQNGAADIVASPLPADPCGQYTLEMIRLSKAMDILGCNACIEAGLDQDLLARTCQLYTSPQYLNLFLEETWKPGITAKLVDPNGKPRSCSSMNWYSANLNVVDIAASDMSCTPTGVGTGTSNLATANISANCEGQLAATQVSVCSLTGTYQGTYSGHTISCAQRDSNGCCIQWGGTKIVSGPVTATFNQSGTSVSGAVYGVDVAGTNIDGSVTAATMVSAACGSIEVPAVLAGTLSSDCSTLTGSFEVGRRRTIEGSFSLTQSTQ